MLPSDPVIEPTVEVIGQGTVRLTGWQRTPEAHPYYGSVHRHVTINAIPAEGWVLVSVGWTHRTHEIRRTYNYDTETIDETELDLVQSRIGSSIDVDSSISSVKDPDGSSYIASELYESAVNLFAIFVRDGLRTGYLIATSGIGGTASPKIQEVNGEPGDEVELSVMANSNDGYQFDNWYGSNCSVIDAHSPGTLVRCFIPSIGSGIYHVVASFKKLPPGPGPGPGPGTKYNVTIAADPNNGGVVGGGGEFEYGYACTLVASRNPGFELMRLVNAAEGITILPRNQPKCFGKTIEHIFTVTKNSSWVAYFRKCTNAILRGHSGNILRGQGGNILRDY